jgi:hypothetical protein
MTHDVEESMTGDDAHTEDAGTRTTPEADAHSDADAHKENVPGRTATFSTRITEEEMERLDAVRNEGESKADFLCRLFDENATFRGSINDLVSSNEHLLKVNTDIRETLEIEQHRHQTQFDDHVYEIGQLQARITTLENAAETAVVPVGGQASLDSFGVKDVIEEARDMCGGDDTECLKIAGKMMDVKLHFASKAVDHEHASEQNRLDRELKEDLAGKERGEKAKDREFREKLTTQEQQNKIELQLLKKGIVKKSVLEDAAFVNISSVPKQPKKVIAEKKKQAFHETEDEETYDYDPEETTDDHID